MPHCGHTQPGQAAQESWGQNMTVGQDQRTNGINERLFVSIVALSVRIVTVAVWANLGERSWQFVSLQFLLWSTELLRCGRSREAHMHPDNYPIGLFHST